MENIENLFKKYEKLNIKIGSLLNLTTKINNKGELKKVPKYPYDWEKKEPVLDIKKNGFFILTGLKSGIFILDLDDMTHEKCIRAKEMADKCCSMIVQTKKGYHYYFKYDNDFNTSPQYEENKKGIFDIRSNGSNVIAPPSKYINVLDNTEIEYKFVKFEDEIKEISKELKDYILNILNAPKLTKKEEKKINEKNEIINEIKQKTKKEDITENDIEDYEYHKNVTYEDKIIIKVIDGLSNERAKNGDSWREAAFAFKSDNYDFKYFDYFSQKENYGGYKDCKDFYDKLKHRTEKEKKITIATIWNWLKKDNIKLFNELHDKFYINILKNEKFRLDKLTDLVILDNNELDIGFHSYFEKSRSYQYFNHFHYYHSKQNSLYLYNDFQVYPYTGFINFLFPNLKVKGLNKKGEIENFSFINLWNESLKKNAIEDIIFDPNPDYISDRNFLNLFHGFKFDDGNYKFSEKIDPFINHIKYICRNNEREYTYFLKWIAFIFQNPHLKTDVCIYLKSKTQGTGKTIIVEFIDKICDYVLMVDGVDELLEKFNGEREGKLFVYVDEVCARGREVGDKIKSIITGSKLKIERKGKDKYTLKDYSNYILSTNHDNVIRVPNGERRMFIIATPEVKLPKDKVKELVTMMKDKEILKEIFNYFKTLDLTDFEPRDIFDTEYKKELILDDLPIYLKAFKYHPEKFTVSKEEENMKWKIKDLYIICKQYAKEEKTKFEDTEKTFEREIFKYFGNYQKRNNQYRYYEFPHDFADLVDDIIEKKTFN